MIFRDLLYLFVLFALAPWLVWRSIRTGRYRRDLAAKLFGSMPGPPDSRPLVWFHGVSVGEIHLLVPVIAAFRKRHPNFAVAVSSTTETGLAEARVKFADCTVLAFPLDFSWAVRGAMDALRPQLIVLAESEMWPNFLAAAAERGVPVAVMNARMSPRSFARLNRLAGLARRLLLKPVSAFAVQSEDYAERLRQLGVSENRIFVTGSVKFDGATGQRDTPKARELGRLFPSSLTLVAGSTHAPEEEIVLRVFRDLKVKHPDLRLILVPRHPDRFAEVAELLKARGASFVRRSQLSEPPPEAPPILLLDTVGELGAAWSLADVGFTGGSLDGHRGGQSMIEPAGYGVPIVFGPHVWNFRDAAKRLVEVGGAIQIRNAEELAPALDRLLSDLEFCKRVAETARQFVQDNQGATTKTLAVLERVLAVGGRQSGG